MEKPIFERANQPVKAISNDPETLEVIRLRELGRVNFNTAMYGAREEGREEGIKQGLERGRKKKSTRDDCYHAQQRHVWRANCVHTRP